MQIGVLAPEFPPMMGGMAELARGLCRTLADSAELRVHCLPGLGLEGSDADPIPFRQKDDLRGRPHLDLPVLQDGDRQVDAWLALNAGLAPLAQRLRAPFFCYLHGNDFVNPWLACGPRWLETFRRPYVADMRHALRRRRIARALPSIRHLLTNSHQTADLVVNTFDLPRDRISVVHPGVGEDFFQEADPRPEGQADTLRILTVTRLSVHTRRKNVDGVLRALAQLPSELDWRYTVVGDGDDRSRLEALAAELGLGERVRFTGGVDFADLLAEYRRADLFVLASKATAKDVEGFGIVYTEASASGVPVICSREGGATDAVDDGVNGLLIDHSSPQAIAEGIRRFVERRQSFDRASVRAFAEQFRWPVIAGRVLEVLESRL